MKRNMSSRANLVWGISSIMWLLSASTSWAQQPPSSARNPLRSADSDSLSNITSSKPTTAVNDTDAIVVCPKAWQTELKPWLTHREQQGLSLSLLDTTATRDELKQKIQTIAAANPQRLKYLLLVGDVASTEVVASGDLSKTIPTYYIDSTAMVRFGSEPHIATDNPYADLNNDGLPELAVGRIPCDNERELRSWVERLIEHEQHNDFSEWRRRVHVVAGVGGFGVLIDSAVEMTAKQFLSQGIPHGYSISLTQASPASPFCPPPSEFANTTINRFNEGGLFWIYMGHGNIRHLDFIRDEDRWHCIMDEQCLHQIQPGPKSPIAVFLACYTGAFDAKEDSIAERLIKQPNGPVAALAGSRMTGPYGMSVLGSEMLEICFEDRCETLGDILQQAKCRSMKKIENGAVAPASADDKRQWIDRLATALSPSNHDLDQERFEHVHMMNLLGDPMLRIRHPEPVTLTIEPTAESASTLKIRGHSPLDGMLTLDLIIRRDRVPEAAKQALQKQKNANKSKEDATPETALSKIEIYDLANQPTLAHRTLMIKAGPFETEIQIPAEAKGACAVRAFVESEENWGLGAQELTIRAPKK
jgi:hypothetical protein